MANRQDLVEKIYENYGGEGSDFTSKAQTKRVVDAVLETMTDTLSDGEDLTLIGFGTFLVKERAARNYVIPFGENKGKKIKKKKCHYIKFKPSGAIKSAIK